MKQYQLAIEQAKLDGPFATFYYLTEGGAGYAGAVAKLVTPGYLPKLPQDPAGRTGVNGYMFLNMTSNYTYVNSDSDTTNTYAIMFFMEAESVFGPSGFYCLTSQGIHPRGTKPGVTSAQCLQQ